MGERAGEVRIDPRLQEIRNLPRNWDGFDGCTFSSQTIAHAQTVLMALEGVGYDVEVTPMPNGTVGFEWSSHGHDGAVEVGNTRGVGYVEKK